MMKTTLIKTIILTFLITISISSCSKNEATAKPVAKAEFLYEEGSGGALSSISDPVATASSYEIFGRNGTSEIVKIKLTNLIVGVYTIGGGNTFTYTRPSTSSPWVAGTGNITITSNTGGKLSGTFDLNSGTSTLGINEVHGRFSTITIN